MSDKDLINKKLTVKQQRFVDAYNGNGVEACKKAGYKGTEVTLAVVASENLRKPNIAYAIKEREKKLTKQKIMSVAEVQKWWSDVVAGLHTDADFKDRLKAAQDLVKSNGGFLDRIEMTGEIDFKAMLTQAHERIKGK